MATTQNYTQPALRERLKKKIKASAKGGKPGQWSARKAQLLASEYKEKGGGYKGKKTDKQKHLTQWTEEKWQTSDGKKAQRRTASGKTTTDRYLPKKAWEKLSASEKTATRKKKQAGSSRGKQFVANTKKAATARRRVTKH
jgi:hypothetical protein